MTTTTLQPPGLEQLAAAHRRGASPSELLDLADGAIEWATEAEDAEALASIAAQLAAAAALHGPDGRGLAIAAARARAAIPATPTPTPSPPTAEQRQPVVPRPSQSPPSACAGWGRRVAGFLIDWFVLMLVLEGTVAASNADSTGAVLALLLLLPLAYFTILHALFARTLGKLLVGTAVRRANGEAIDFGVAILRTIVQGVVAVIPLGFFVDSLWPLWDPRSQTLHDKAAGTVVVRTSSQH